MTADRHEVLDAPKGTPVKSGEAELAKNSQVKPKSLEEAQKCQEEKRKNYDTTSTTCLPRMHISPEFLTADLARGVVGDAAGKKAKDAQESKPDAAKPAEVDVEKTIQRFKDAKVPLSPEQEKQLRADLADIEKLPPETRQKVYESLDKIATADTKDSTKLAPAERAELVTSLAHQIAHPESIKQGRKETCVAANVEKTLATQHPDQYADMIAQLAIKGEYTLPPGKDGKAPDPATIKAQRDADGTLADASDASKERSRTSDLAQGVIVNLGMGKNEGEYRSYPPGSADLRPTPAGVDPATDEGERVVTKVYGDEAKRLGVKDGEEVKKSFDGLSPDAKERVLDKLCPGDGYEGRLINNVDDLGKAWKDNGEKPPLNVGVRMDAPFLEKGSQAAGTHALTITHIEFDKDGKASKVYYDNPAGGPDHSYPNGKPVPADEFVKGMQAKGRQPNSDGQVESWDQPLRATVRTDNQPDRQDKRLDEAAEEFHNAKNGDEMKKALEGKTRAEISEMNRIHQEKYGKSMATAVDENTSLKINKDKKAEVQEALKGKDTSFANDPRHPMGLQNFTEYELKKLQNDDGDVKGLDWRETKGTQKNADNTTTTNYEGEVETGTWDNGFKASETRDANGDLVASKIAYDSPINQKFVTPQGEVEIKDIKSIETKRDASGNDVTTITDKDGKVHTFVTDPKRNAVVGYKKPGE